MTLGDQYGTECPHCEEPIDMEQREAIREGQRFRCRTATTRLSST